MKRTRWWILAALAVALAFGLWWSRGRRVEPGSWLLVELGGEYLETEVPPLARALGPGAAAGDRAAAREGQAHRRLPRAREVRQQPRVLRRLGGRRGLRRPGHAEPLRRAGRRGPLPRRAVPGAP